MWHYIRAIYLKLSAIRNFLEDKRLGVVTGEQHVAQILGRSGKGTSPASYHFYRATPYRTAHRILRRLHPTTTDGLLDIGCGSGRFICCAAQYPFARIIGLEIDKTICALAGENVRNLRVAKVRPEILCENAIAYDVPDEITIVYFYNSFTGDHFRQVLARIVATHDRKPRRLWLAYVNPQDEASVDAMGRLRSVDHFIFGWRPGAEWQRTKTVKVYEVMPAAT